MSHWNYPPASGFYWVWPRCVDSDWTGKPEVWEFYVTGSGPEGVWYAPGDEADKSTAVWIERWFGPLVPPDAKNATFANPLTVTLTRCTDPRNELMDADSMAGTVTRAGYEAGIVRPVMRFQTDRAGEMVPGTAEFLTRDEAGVPAAPGGAEQTYFAPVPTTDPVFVSGSIGGVAPLIPAETWKARPVVRSTVVKNNKPCITGTVDYYTGGASVWTDANHPKCPRCRAFVAAGRPCGICASRADAPHIVEEPADE